jgi:REP element-mobilizing transposase RayT
MSKGVARPARLKSSSRSCSKAEPKASKKSRSTKAQQLALVSSWQKHHFAFGGTRLKKSHAKTKRPFVKNLPIHVVLKSSQAVGSRSLLRRARRVDALVLEEAMKHHVALLAVANSGNHLHLLVEAPSSFHLSDFLRAITGRIAMLLTGARKGSPLRSAAGPAQDAQSRAQHTQGPGQAAAEQSTSRPSSITGRPPSLQNAPRPAPHTPFWDQRPFTRIVSEGRDKLHVLRYLTMNSTESFSGKSRASVREMFREIQERMKSGELLRSPGLSAAGFV